VLAGPEIMVDANLVLPQRHDGVDLRRAAGGLPYSSTPRSVAAVGIASFLAAVTLRQHRAGAAGRSAAPLVAVGRALAAVHDWTFLVGPNLVLGTNTVLLTYLLYRSGLVPRLIAVLGLLGGPLIFAPAVAPPASTTR
jgi:hypothetical protein